MARLTINEISQTVILAECQSYINDCSLSERMPTLQGWLKWIDVSKDDWDDWIKTNKRACASACKKSVDWLVDAIMQFAVKYPNLQATCIFYCKAAFGMYDRPFEDKSTSTTVSITLDKAWSDLGK